MYDIVIVGGGAAGLFCVAMINELLPKSKKVLLAEKTSTLGNKLILSGSGQCNFTHAGNMKDFSLHYGDNYSFLKPALYNLSNTTLIKFFEKLDIKSLIRDDLKVFPKHKSSEIIKNTLIHQADRYGAEIKTNYTLNKIEIHETFIRLNFLNSVSRVMIKTKYLILCTGGKSYKVTGSEGDIIPLLSDLNIKIKPFKPALSVPYVKYVDEVNTKPQNISKLAGITLNNASMSIYRGGKQIYKRNGALLFTHTGLSGPLILDNSKYYEPGDTLFIYLTKFTELEDFDKYFLELIELNPLKRVSNLLLEIDIPKNLINFVLKDINEGMLNSKSSSLTKLDRKHLIKKLFYMEYKIIRLGDIDDAMCCSGGVDLSEINKKNMSLKKYPNIFVAGECIDVDGDTGGYNIHAAFATGHLIIKHLTEEIK